jgi:hypothetical protein
MAAVASHQLLFHLSLPFDDHAIPEVIPDLPDIKPRFVLPLLDEHASGTEKLLGSLRRALMSPADVYGVPKGFDGEAGKTDIVEKVRVEQGEENLMIWEEAARENEAGPSRRPTFTVSQTRKSSH